MNKLEFADTLSAISSFFRVSDEEVLSKGQHLVTDLGNGHLVVSQSDYMVLRRFLFTLRPELKPLNVHTLKRRLLSLHNNEKAVLKYINNSPYIVEEPITSNKYVWTDTVVEAFFDFLKTEMEEAVHSISNLSSLTGYPKEKLYYLATHFNLRRGMDAEQLDSEVFSTLLLFLSRFELVSDSSLVSRVSKLSPRSVVKVRYVGNFVEKSLVNYVNTKSEDFVVTLNGSEYVAIDNVLGYLTHKGARVYRNPSHLTVLLPSVSETIDDGVYVPVSVLDKALEYKPNKKSWSFYEALALSCGLLSEEEYARLLNRAQLVDILSTLETEGIISKNLKRHLSSSLDSESPVPSIQLHSPEALIDVLTQHLYKLPVDGLHSNYVSVYLLVEFLNQSNESYQAPAFLYKHPSEGYILSNRSSEWVEFVSYSIAVTHIRNLDAQLYMDYTAWLGIKFESQIKRINELVRGA